MIPGAAERIIAMAEKDAEHQRDMERMALAAERRERRIGQIFALIIGLSALAAAVGCAYIGATAVAATIGGGTVVGLVTVFVTGRILGK